MANGSGVSIAESSGGRWRVRWRETLDDGAVRQRERVVRDHATAIELSAKILRVIETGGVYQPERAREVAVASLDAVGSGWIEARRTRGASRNTIRNDIATVARLLRAIRSVEQIPEDRPVPVSVLSRDLVIRATASLQRVAGESTVAHTVGALLSLWGWASDDPATYPGVPTPPRDTSSIRPSVTPSVAGPAPSMVECDAVLRVLSATPNTTRVALPVAVIARMTGLRVGQVLGIEVRDLNLVACTLQVRVGKSRREKAERRTIPIAATLRDWLVPLHGQAVQESRTTLIARAPGAAGVESPAKTLHRAWEGATGSGQVRREVWAPEGRTLARPDHAFRAAFQHALVEAGVRDEVIDALVGHAGGLRGRHYVDVSARMAAMRDAVGRIPAIDWSGPAAGGEATDNVMQLRR